MLFRTFSALPLGMDSIRVEIEAVSTQGVPSFILIGLPSKAVDESRERITSALLHCGIRIRSKRTIVNLAPADLKKTNNALELGIAVAILKMYGEISIPTDDTLFLGELSLSGQIKPVTGALSLVMAAKKMGFKSVIFPFGNISEVQMVEGIDLYPIKHLQEYISFGKNKGVLLPIHQISIQKKKREHEVDFKDVHGQVEAKRALEIAVAGGHNVFFLGPPGVGKSMLAKAATSILPALSKNEMVEVSHIYSLAGLFSAESVCTRPFRSPHHSISKAALIGGAQLKPGEISLAHRGVLFLDELPEFSRDTLEALRQPMEDGNVVIARAEGVFSFPAQCMLIAAANPCPCGYFLNSTKKCQCTDNQVRQYRSKISGPLMDRIDLHVEVQPVDVASLQLLVHGNTKDKTDKSEIIAQRVSSARKSQRSRYKNAIQTNATLGREDVKKWCVLDTKSQELLVQGANVLSLSARGYFKVLKIARTIADLDGVEMIQEAHILEALNYRPKV